MMNASNAILVDTNILVYSHDPRDRQKQAQAIAVLNGLLLIQRAVLSVQCLSEFFNVVTRRLPDPMTNVQALRQVERFSRACLVLPLTPAATIEGCRGVAQHGLSLWDALIWSVAKLNQVPYVLTEDAQHGRFLDGVGYLNPFDPAFDPKRIGIVV